MTSTTTPKYLQGVDISKHQGKAVDHTKFIAADMTFCMCKATEGVGYVDPQFKRNIDAILKLQHSGLVYLPGAYHFARPDTGGGRDDGVAEGEAFCTAVLSAVSSAEHNFMPPTLDFEKYSESDKKDNIEWIQGWVGVVERRLRRKPMIYTGANVWKYEVGNTAIFKHLPLWQVYYSKTARNPVKTPWDSWTMWQWSGGGSFAYAPPVPGVGVVDVNRFYGTLEQLQDLGNVQAIR